MLLTTDDKFPLYSECEKKRMFDKNNFLDELPQLIKKPFPTSFYISLLELEEKILIDSKNTNFLDEVMDYYSKLTNFYAYKKDPIQYYFKEKFEITSASKEAQKIIMKSNINVYHSPENRSTIFKRLIRGFDLIPEESNENENPNNYQMHLPNNRYSFSKKKKLRQERLKLLQEIQKKKKEEIIDMSKLMTNFLEKSKINDDVVCNDLRKQMENITLKVNHRKMSVSLNLTNCNSSTSFRFGGNEPSEIKIIDAELTTNITLNDILSNHNTANSD